MREYIIADNQDISKAGMMFLLSKQKDVATLLEADNKAELIQQLRLYPQAVVVLDYTLFDFAGADELIVLQERFKEVDWILPDDRGFSNRYIRADPLEYLRDDAGYNTKLPHIGISSLLFFQHYQPFNEYCRRSDRI
jgi:DNA-binding NarL/FixJ family response regulator